MVVFHIMPKNGESQTGLHFKTLKFYITVRSCIDWLVGFMVSATFNNISVIQYRGCQFYW